MNEVNDKKLSFKGFFQKDLWQSFHFIQALILSIKPFLVFGQMKLYWKHSGANNYHIPC